MKNKNGFVTSPLIIIIVILVLGLGFYIFFQNQSKITRTSLATLSNGAVATSTENGFTDIPQDDFTPTFGKPYTEAKKELSAKGWETYIPKDSISAGDKQFPEIGDCGSGVDAICFVNFKKGNDNAHLDVQIGGRPPYGPYSVWTVIGND